MSEMAWFQQSGAKMTTGYDYETLIVNRQRVRFVAVLLMMLNFRAEVAIHAQNAEDVLPAFSKGWTDSEKAQFKECVVHISDRSRENTLQLKTDIGACFYFEEREHWLNLHPQARGKKENPIKEHKCSVKHPLQWKGTAEEFHASFDLCMCAAYGLPKPKL